MTFSLSIPCCKPKGPLQLAVNVGEMLFILGANRTGKSSLMQAFSSACRENTRRITAHRQTWFRSASPEFTGQQRTDYEQNVVQHDRNSNARWQDDYSQQRTQMAIFDLVNSQNVRAREVMRASYSLKESNTVSISHCTAYFSPMHQLWRRRAAETWKTQLLASKALQNFIG